eukprot:gene788-329_t
MVPDDLERSRQKCAQWQFKNAYGVADCVSLYNSARSNYQGQKKCLSQVTINAQGERGYRQRMNDKKQVEGSDLDANIAAVRRKIGYCPQENALYEHLTVKEHLYMYGRIKGMPSKALAEDVQNKLKELNLELYTNKLAGTLSGGNKRKLMMGIALMGNPSILLLDEPSAGVDPVARKFMWSVIAKLASDKHSTVVLSTHSMEECEALCTKTVIMTNGVFRTVNSNAGIKAEYAQGQNAVNYIVRCLQTNAKEVAKMMQDYDMPIFAIRVEK